MITTRLPKTITAGALLATPIPPVKWIIPGLLPAGLAIFAGPSKAGKSWLTLWLCLQISQGKSVWGREIEPRTVLYFSLEDTLGRLQERLYKLVDAEEDPERLILQTESHGIGQGLEEQIVSFVHTYPDISLIVIDTLQKVRKADRNGSMYANDYKDIGALKELADKYGICILLVHHLRKQSSSDPYDQISGSTGIMGVADTTWLMHRQRMSKTATVRVIGRDMDEKMLHIREENCVWTLDEEETAEQQALKAIPDYLWKVADYIDSVGKWQGTATKLLVAANISDVKPNQFTRKMAHYARDVFSPRGIEYKYTRTEQKRLFEFFHDDDDGDDDDIDISELFHWGIPQTSSSSSASSLRSLEGSEHTIEARSGACSDTIAIRKVDKPNPAYVKAGGEVVNWFDREDEIVKEGYFSIKDSMGDVKAHPQASAVLNELIAPLQAKAAAAYGDVAKNIQIPESMQRMMDKMSVEATLKQMGKLVTPAFVHELNAALNQVKKEG